MQKLDERLRECRIRQQALQPDENMILLTIQKSKDALYQRERMHRVSWMEFLLWQADYIEKRWWILQAVLLTVLWRTLTVKRDGIYLQRCIGMLAPVFAILLLPELWKNRNSKALEIEGTAYYSLRQIYAARTLLFGIVDLLLLSIFFVAASFTVSMAVREMVIQFFLPFNITCCICFRTLYSKWFASEYLALALCMVWTAVWSFVVLRAGLYEAVSEAAWLGAVVFSTLYLCCSIYRMLKNCGICAGA